MKNVRFFGKFHIFQFKKAQTFIRAKPSNCHMGYTFQLISSSRNNTCTACERDRGKSCRFGAVVAALVTSIKLNYSVRRAQLVLGLVTSGGFTIPVYIYPGHSAWPSLSG